MQSLDKLTLEEVKKKAVEDAKILCTKTNISKHAVVNSNCGMSYINFMENINCINFTITENPFGIYDEKLTPEDLEKRKAVDYSFPITCVSANVVVYFSEFTKHVNENFDFSTIKGETTWQDERTEETGTFSKVREFFTMPKKKKTQEKASEPTMRAHIRIEPKPFVKGVAPSSYNLVFKKYSGEMIDEIKSLQELMGLSVKRASHRVYIRPHKLNSSYIHYGDKYKISWQILAIKETQLRTDMSDMLKKMLICDDDEKQEQQVQEHETPANLVDELESDDD